jgi:hypothetical protein
VFQQEPPPQPPSRKTKRVWKEETRPEAVADKPLLKAVDTVVGDAMTSLTDTTDAVVLFALLAIAESMCTSIKSIQLISSELA